MTMMSMYIISSCGEHLQEAEVGMGDGVGWLGGRWGVTLYFFSIVKFSCVGFISRRGGLPIYFKSWMIVRRSVMRSVFQGWILGGVY